MIGPFVEPFRAGGAEVRLGRRHVGRHALPRAAAHPAELALARLGEQRADRPLGLRVLALAEVHVAHLPVRVDQVVRRPVLVRVGVPGGVVVVLCHRVLDPVLLDRIAHVAGVLLERELRCVDRR